MSYGVRIINALDIVNQDNKIGDWSGETTEFRTIFELIHLNTIQIIFLILYKIKFAYGYDQRIKMVNTIAIIEVNIVMCNLFGCSFVFICVHWKCIV